MCAGAVISTEGQRTERARRRGVSGRAALPPMNVGWRLQRPGAFAPFCTPITSSSQTSEASREATPGPGDSRVPATSYMDSALACRAARGQATWRRDGRDCALPTSARWAPRGSSSGGYAAAALVPRAGRRGVRVEAFSLLKNREWALSC